jgi:uncharacterized membrane protein YkvA (DUF1232 family)
MGDESTKRSVSVAVAALVLALWLATPILQPPAACASVPLALPVHVLAASGAVAVAPSFDRDMQRTMTRAERSMTRFTLVLGYVALLWLWAALNALAFLATAALASVADVRMLGLWRHEAHELSHYLASGIRTFLRLLGDRRTPLAARLVLGVGLVYWLLPADLIGEGFFLSDEGMHPFGFIEDIVIAAVAAKLFMYLCPDTLVAQHAAAVEHRVHAHA